MNNRVQVGDGKLLVAEGQADIILDLKFPSGNLVKCKLKNVLYVPELAHNLISVSQITRDGKVVKFYDSSCTIFHGEKIIAHGSKINNLFILDRPIESTSVALLPNIPECELD